MLCPVCRKEFLDESCGFLVFMNSECPVCLEDTTPLIALPCGHAMCKNDFEAIGGVLINEDSSCCDEPQKLKSCRVPEETIQQEERHQSIQQHQSLQSTSTRQSPQPQQVRSRVVSPRVNERNRRERNVPTPVQQNQQQLSSAWILCSATNERRSILRGQKSQLWHVTGERRERPTHRYRERSMYQYPKSATYAGDGRYGIWVLCDTLNANDNGLGSTWRLWHADGTETRERDMYAFPKGSQLAGDGRGGVWVLSRTVLREGGRRRLVARLWHVNERRERDLYNYPTDSIIFGDGRRGVWVHCRASDGSWWLWHASRQGERKMFQYPKTSKFAADGVGGVWALCPKGNDCTRSKWRLWHGKSNGWERNFYGFPSKSELAGDGRGGVWVLSSRDGDRERNLYRLWHVTEESCLPVPLSYHASSQLVADGCGNLLILTPSNGFKWLVRVNNEHRAQRLFRYPKDAKLIAPM